MKDTEKDMNTISISTGSPNSFKESCGGGFQMSV